MPKPASRACSAYTREAVALLGKLIRQARIEKQITAHELAERAGVSRGLLQRIEKGDLKCEIGAAFELAAILGITLFDVPTELTAHHQRVTDRLALLPRYARPKTEEVKDDF